VVHGGVGKKSHSIENPAKKEESSKTKTTTDKKRVKDITARDPREDKNWGGKIKGFHEELAWVHVTGV